MGQAQNLATRRDGPGLFEAVPSRSETSRGTKSSSILPINTIFRTFLSQDKGKVGQGNFFVLGQRNDKTSRPGLSRYVRPTGRPVSRKP